jgi:hypothetical protein
MPVTTNIPGTICDEIPGARRAKTRRQRKELMDYQQMEVRDESAQTDLLLGGA